MKHAIIGNIVLIFIASAGMISVECLTKLSITGPVLPPDTAFTTSPAVEGTAYANPVIPGFYPDPSICRVGGDYYLVNSSFGYFPGIPVFHSRDLAHWKQIGHCLTRKSQLNLARAHTSGGIFAPTIRYHNGIFYVIVANCGSIGCFFVTARDPAGPWSEPVLVNTGAGDPSLFFDDDGKVYLTAVEGLDYNARLFQFEIDIASGKVRGQKTIIWKGDGDAWIEGPHLYKINGYYYLMAASGGTGSNHHEIIAGSNYPFGPFIACPHNPILSHKNMKDSIQCTGHADLVDDGQGNWWAVFLAVRYLDNTWSVLGRETFLAPVQWVRGWPIIGENGRVKLTMKGPLQTAGVAESLKGRDDFNESVLSSEWCFIRNPDPASWSLSGRPGFLRLSGSTGTLSDTGTMTFIGSRQRHFAMIARTRVLFNPAEVGEEAGLTVRLQEDAHYEIAMIKKTGGNRIIVRLCTIGSTTIVDSVPFSGGECFLQIEGNDKAYSFSFAADTTAWQKIATAEAWRISQESYPYCYTGVLVGMYATGNGKRSVAPADFDWFEYIPK